MLLNSPLYFIFLAAVALVNGLLLRTRWRTWWLLLASYVFYATFDVRFPLILLALTVAVYFLGQAIRAGSRPKLYALLSAVLCLGVLAIFKYLDFFMASVTSGLALLGIQALSPVLGLLLPIGISFYTFQALAYTTEIYRGRLEPVQRFEDLALYLAFFPKLIAGPLVRTDKFMAEINKPLPLNRERVISALQLFLLGLFKKVVIADSLASLAVIAFRAAHYPNALDFPAPLYWQGFYLYAFQIYADFSGYTDLARASAALLGFELPENFQQPYLATTLGQFWNRWHMTVTQWFREYLFFPLSRAWLKATDRRYPRAIQIAANLITMVLIGLWHGAAWTFVAWGLWHGLLLTGERLLNLQPQRRWLGILSAIVTFHLVALGWVLFAANSFTDAVRFVEGMVLGGQWLWLWQYAPPVLLAGALVFGIDLAAAGVWPRGTAWLNKQRPIWVVAVVVLVSALLILNQVRGSDTRPFIYGRF